MELEISLRKLGFFGEMKHFHYISERVSDIISRRVKQSCIETGRNGLVFLRKRGVYNSEIT